MGATDTPVFASGSGVTVLTGGGLDAINARNTVNVDPAGDVPLEKYAISPTIYIKNGEAFPLTKLLNSKPMRVLNNADDRYRWKEDVLLPQADALASSLTVGATDIVVDDASKFKQNDVVWIKYADAQGHVSSVNTTTNTVSVTWTHAPAVVVPTDSAIVRIGTAHEQYSQHVNSPTTLTTEEYNVYQDFRNGVAASDQHIAGNFLIPKEGDWQYQLNKQREEHLVEHEKTFLFGQRAFVTSGNSPLGFMGGLYYQATTNSESFSDAALTRNGWDDALSTLFRKNKHLNQQWWVFCSGMIHSQVVGFSTTYERTETNAEQFGMSWYRYKHPEGKIVNLKPHPLFDLHGWDDVAIIINMTPDVIARVVHSRFDTKRYKSIIPYGASGQEEFYRTIDTLMVRGEDINLKVIEDVGAA